MGVISSIHSIGQSMTLLYTKKAFNQSISSTAESGTELLELERCHNMLLWPFGQQLLLNRVGLQLPLHVDPGAFFGTREVLSQSGPGQRSTAVPVRQPGGSNGSAFAFSIGARTFPGMPGGAVIGRICWMPVVERRTWCLSWPSSAPLAWSSRKCAFRGSPWAPPGFCTSRSRLLLFRNLCWAALRIRRD